MVCSECGEARSTKVYAKGLCRSHYDKCRVLAKKKDTVKPIVKPKEVDSKFEEVTPVRRDYPKFDDMYDGYVIERANTAAMTKTQLIQFSYRNIGIRLSDSLPKEELAGRVSNMIRMFRVM